MRNLITQPQPKLVASFIAAQEAKWTTASPLDLLIAKEEAELAEKQINDAQDEITETRARRDAALNSGTTTLLTRRFRRCS